MPMLYDYSGPGAFTPVPVCPSSGPAEGPLIRLESLCHFDAVSTYRVIRDGLPELLTKYLAQGGRVMTLEPHLKVFAALSSLEQKGEKSAVNDAAYSSNTEAFRAAADGLKRVLASI